MRAASTEDLGRPDGTRGTDRNLPRRDRAFARMHRRAGMGNVGTTTMNIPTTSTRRYEPCFEAAILDKEPLS